MVNHCSIPDRIEPIEPDRSTRLAALPTAPYRSPCVATGHGSRTLASRSDRDTATKVAALAQGLLMRRRSRLDPDFSLLDHLDAAGITDASSLDNLIDGGRHAARDALKIATLEEAGWVLSALDRARKELAKARSKRAAARRPSTPSR